MTNSMTVSGTTKEKIHYLYRGHKAIQARAKNETFSELLARENKSSHKGGVDHKAVIDKLLIIGGIAGLITPFVTESPFGYLAGFMGSAATATAITSITDSSFDRVKGYLDEIKNSMLSAVSKREAVSIESMGRPVPYDKALLINMAIAKCTELLEAEDVPGQAFYIASKYGFLNMNEDQRQFFDNAIHSIQRDFKYCLYSKDINELIDALHASETGDIRIGRDGITEQVGGEVRILSSSHGVRAAM